MSKSLDDSIQYLKGIGPKRAKALSRFGIRTVKDLFWHFPLRYEDRRSFVPLSKINSESFFTIRAGIVSKNIRKTRSMNIFEIIIDDGTARATVNYFKQVYLDKTFKIGDVVIFAGKCSFYKHKLQFNSPEYEILKNDEDAVIHAGCVVPVYPLAAGIIQRPFRKAMRQLIDDYLFLIEENLSVTVLKKYCLISRQEAFLNVHFPEKPEMLDLARKRIVFEEFFFFEKNVALNINKRKQIKSAFAFNFYDIEINIFKKALSFSLTKSQTRAIEEIKKSLNSPYPMNRLLQGDVGSGKTVVAACSLFLIAKSGFQGALLVPTEIVATQHFKNIFTYFQKLNISIALLTGSTGKKKRKQILQELKSNRISILIGTHALIQDDVDFFNLALVIVDEQHKFGVKQREFLLNRKHMPHLMLMTATPIPRTLGLTLYGDMDVTTLTDLPFGDRDVNTYWISPEKEDKMYGFVKEKIDNGEQAYIVYPLVEESEKIDLKAAVKEYERLEKGAFANYKLGLIHGKMNSSDKNQIMVDFKSGVIHVLVSTTVIEVGVDNQNASIIIIEHAERFGLSQLHQMRGRVGRGRKESFCFLLGNPKTDIGKRRLRFMTKTNDGFKIAEADLLLRGPGDFLGIRQSGLPEFKMADIVKDINILKEAKKAVLENP